MKAEVASPFPDRPSEGSLSFSVDASALSSSSKISEIEITRQIERAVRDSDALDLESLCLVSGERVWAIACDVALLSSGGGAAIDVCVLAAMAALRAFRKPEVR